MNKTELQSFYKSDGTSDFLLIEDEKLFFWGANIPSNVFTLNETILKQANELQIPKNEVVELFEDNVVAFFEAVYLP
jgi:hypothetical protein